MSNDGKKYDFERFSPEYRSNREPHRISASEKRKKERTEALIRLIFRAVALAVAVLIAVLIIKALPHKKKTAGEKAKTVSSAPAKSTVSDIPKAEEKSENKTSLPKMDAAAVGEDIKSPYIAVLDCDTNTIIAGRAAKERMFPASTTKIMTALIVCERTKNFDDTFIMTADIIDPLYRQEATLAGFSYGEPVTVRDLVYGTVLPSGADAATAAAIYTAGSESAFVELMNERVKSLGLTDTHFANMTGLHDENNYSTAYDMAVILREALKNDFCKQVLSTYQYTTAATAYHPNGVPLTSTLFSYMYGTEPEGADILGGKTGYVAESGYCIASYGVSESGKTYICVTGKGQSRWPTVFDQINLYTQFAK